MNECKALQAPGFQRALWTDWESGQGREDPGACWMGCDLGRLWCEGYQRGWHGNAEEVVQEAGHPRPLGATCLSLESGGLILKGQ